MIDDTLLEAEDKMDKAVAVAQEDFAAIRTGRANPAMFNKITVDYYGTPTPLQQLASFAAPEARMMIVTPVRQVHHRCGRTGDPRLRPRREPRLRRHDRACRPAAVDRGTPPRVHQDRQARRPRTPGSSIRNVRRHANQVLDRLVKDGEVGEDDVKRAEKHLDDVTHKHVAHIDDMLKHKEAELLEV